MSREVVVVDGLRTPYAKAGTLLKDVPAQELARIVTTELLARTGFEADGLDEVIFGNIAQPPDAVNLARVAALLAGVPRRVPAFTVNRLCGSGLQSITDAWYRIAGGDAHAIVAGGVESMSNIPFLYSRESQEIFTELFTAKDLGKRAAAATRFRPKHFKPEIGLQQGPDRRGLRVEHGRDGGAPREGARHLARGAGRVRAPVAPARHARAQVQARRGDRAGTRAAALRADGGGRTTASARIRRWRPWRKLKPYFDRKFGTVTAGNSSQITDGGAATLIMSAKAATRAALPPARKDPRVRVRRRRSGADGSRARRSPRRSP